MAEINQKAYFFRTGLAKNLTFSGVYYSNSQKADRNFPAYNKKSREVLTLIDQRQ
jgi:hypothetical protein